MACIRTMTAFGIGMILPANLLVVVNSFFAFSLLATLTSTLTPVPLSLTTRLDTLGRGETLVHQTTTTNSFSSSSSAAAAAAAVAALTVPPREVSRLVFSSLGMSSSDDADELLERAGSHFNAYIRGRYPLSGSSQPINESSRSKKSAQHSYFIAKEATREGCKNAASSASEQTGGNVTAFDLASQTTEISPLCKNRTAQLKQSVQHGEEWALKMMDAHGRPGPGVFQRRLSWFGAFDECLGVEASPRLTNSSWRGQYCLLTVSIKEIANVTAVVGVCMPEGCSNSDVYTAMVDEGVPGLRDTYVTLDQIANVDCKPRNSPLDATSKGVLSLLSLVTMIIIGATLFDVFMLNKATHKVSAGPKDLSVLLRPSSVRPTEETKLLRRPLRATNEPTLPVVLQLFLSFSLKTGWKKLTAPENEEKDCQSLAEGQRSPNVLRCLHGLRVLTMLWMIMSHTCHYATVVPAANTIHAWERYRKWWLIQPVMNGILGADIFFTLSGLLVGYHTLGYMDKLAQRPNLFRFYFRRFLRLTPLYALVIAIAAGISPHLGDGPLWPVTGPGGQCRASWWVNLLYVNNFVTEEKACLDWTWYLDNDMQLYLISPLVIFVFYYYPVIGMLVCFVLTAASVVATGFVTKHYSVPAGPSERLDFMRGEFYQHYVVKPYCRAAPYVVGVLTGCLLQRNCTARFSKILNSCVWAAVIASCHAVLYGTVGMAGSSQSVTSIYLAMRHVVMGAGVAWLVYACSTNNARRLNAVLSWKGWVALSRLTYCVYLTHPLAILSYYLSLRIPFFFSKFNITVAFIANTFISYAAAFLLFVTFEAPTREITRISL